MDVSMLADNGLDAADYIYRQDAYLTKLKEQSIEEKWFCPSEVALHNAEDDLWLSWLGYVYDLTPLALANKGNPLLTPMLKNAGQDVSQWFDETSGDVRTHVHPISNIEQYYTPEGRFLHIPPPLPSTSFDIQEFDLPWWRDKKRYCIGRLSTRTRMIRIMNILTGVETTLEVCSEEALGAIQQRYLKFNSHAKGYMWKRLGKLLDMTKTLEENGLKYENDIFNKLGWNEDEHLPVIHLYFADDLTIA